MTHQINASSMFRAMSNRWKEKIIFQKWELIDKRVFERSFCEKMEIKSEIEVSIIEHVNSSNVDDAIDNFLN